MYEAVVSTLTRKPPLLRRASPQRQLHLHTGSCVLVYCVCRFLPTPWASVSYLLLLWLTDFMFVHYAQLPGQHTTHTTEAINARWNNQFTPDYYFLFIIPHGPGGSDLEPCTGCAGLALSAATPFPHRYVCNDLGPGN